MGKVMAARTARQECVRISLNCVALAVLTAAVLIIGVGVPAPFAFRYTGDLLAVTALAQGVRRVSRPIPAYQRNAATREFSVDVLRAIALAATMTAAAFSLMMFLRG